MKSVINKDGEFVCTFSGGEIDMSDPAMAGCTVVDGTGPLDDKLSTMREEARAAGEVAKAERDEEHNHIDELEARILKLEELIKSQ